MHFSHLEITPHWNLFKPSPTFPVHPKVVLTPLLFSVNRLSHSLTLPIPLPHPRENGRISQQGPQLSSGTPNLQVSPLSNLQTSSSLCIQKQPSRTPPPALHFPRVSHLGLVPASRSGRVGTGRHPGQPTRRPACPRGAGGSGAAQKVAILIAGRHEPPPVPTYLSYQARTPPQYLPT